MGAVQLENDLAAAIEALGEDQKFLSELKKGCDTKAEDFDCAVKTRNAELAAIADTIKVLNDDDALELFKKTLPSSASSFMEVKASSKALRVKAMSALTAARKTADSKDR